MLKHGSLFSGIGGFDIAAQWAGWTNVFHCEINPFGQKVLRYYWPDADLIKDITKADFTKYARTIDVISGGFPCQPFSAAGKRKGTEDNRHLWPRMLEVIKQIQPLYVVGENVAGIGSMELQNSLSAVESNPDSSEDGEDYYTSVLDGVCNDLEGIGYEVQPFIIPACAVNAPHRRDRVWFVAYSKNNRCGGREDRQCEMRERELFQGEQGRCKMGNKTEGCCGERLISDTKSWRTRRIRNTDEETGTQNSPELLGGECRMENNEWIAPNPSNEQLQRSKFNGSIRSTGETETKGRQFSRSIPPIWDQFPTQPPVCFRNDGIPSGLVGITVSKHRIESIKAAGNAIVPQVAYEIFKAINEVELNKTPF